MKVQRRIWLSILMLLAGMALSGCVYQAVPFQYDLKLKTKADNLVIEKGGDMAAVEITIDSRRYHDLSSEENVFLSYHILGQDGALIEQDGIRTRLTQVPARGVGKETVDIAAPLEAGSYTVEIDLVEEGVTWFSAMGMPTLKIPMEVRETGVVDYAQVFLSTDVTGLAVSQGEEYQIPVSIQNDSGTGLYPTGSVQVLFSYYVKDLSGSILAEGERIRLPGNIGSGAGSVVAFTPQAEILKQPGSYILEVDLVIEGVSWFKDYGVTPLEIPIVINPGTDNTTQTTETKNQ